jgi:hypothetical protein
MAHSVYCSRRLSQPPAHLRPLIMSGRGGDEDYSQPREGAVPMPSLV